VLALACPLQPAGRSRVLDLVLESLVQKGFFEYEYGDEDDV
jgi:hypothetical protein